MTQADPHWAYPPSMTPTVWSQGPIGCVRCGETIFSGDPVVVLGNQWVHSYCSGPPVPTPWIQPPSTVPVPVLYGQPTYVQPIPTVSIRSQPDGLATPSFVLALIGFFLPWVGNILSIIAIIMAAVSLGRTTAATPNRGLAVAGLVIGILGIVLFFW